MGPTGTILGRTVLHSIENIFSSLRTIPLFGFVLFSWHFPSALLFKRRLQSSGVRDGGTQSVSPHWVWSVKQMK